MSIRRVVWGSHKSRDQKNEVPGTDVTFQQSKNNRVKITSTERSNKSHSIFIIKNNIDCPN